jgi:hypothetical protein
MRSMVVLGLLWGKMDQMLPHSRHRQLKLFSEFQILWVEKLHVGWILPILAIWYYEIGSERST